PHALPYYAYSIRSHTYIPLSILTILPPPTRPTLFPYTTLFRSKSVRNAQLLYWSAEGDVNPGRSETQLATAHRLTRSTSPSALQDRKSTRLNSSHGSISYAVFCLKKKKNKKQESTT